MNEEQSPEQLESCRRRAEALLEAAAERIFGSPHRNADEVKIHFDWVPVLTNDCITFRTTIVRRSNQSCVEYDVDLHRLHGIDLQRLHDLLANRPKGYWLVHELTWLLGISLVQQMPALTAEVLAQRVRELLSA